jgi:hypothetical protein
MRRFNVEFLLRRGIDPSRGGAMAREYQGVNVPLLNHADFQIVAKWRD